eukprot:9467960-Pyramimonas_sp.AAC.1
MVSMGVSGRRPPSLPLRCRSASSASKLLSTCNVHTHAFNVHVCASNVHTHASNVRAAPRLAPPPSCLAPVPIPNNIRGRKKGSPTIGWSTGHKARATGQLGGPASRGLERYKKKEEGE